MAYDTSGDLAGRTLGQYQIEDIIGSGGMATVYRAYQTSIGRTVAIKVMPPHFMHDATFMQRFEREVRVIADLQHPRVLPVYDYGQLEGRPYIVMAYMAGGTLSDRIEQGALDLDEAVRLVEQIAEGLDHAHRKGVVHRDFKPSNVLLDDHNNVYLADFGIAKISETTVQLTGTGIVGTPAYMAPEMGREGAVSPAVDIYALGITLYQMLTGRLPFKGDTPLSVMMAHATTPAPDVREDRPDLPPGIAAVIQQALAKEPEDRYASAGELAAALRRAAAEPVPASGAQTARMQPPPAATVVEDWTGVPSTPPPVTPPPVSTPPASAPYPAAAPAPEKRGGCRWSVVGIIAGVVGGIGLCVVLLLALGVIGSLPAGLVAPTPPPTFTPEPTPTLTPEPVIIQPPTPEVLPPASTPEQLSGMASLVIENRSSTTVCYVQLSPTTDDTWGDDQLDPDTVIDPGGRFTLNNIPYGLYDYRALDCSQNVLDEHYSVDLSGSSFLWTVRNLDTPLTLVNGSSYSVCELYVSGLEDGVWGINRLAQGQSVTQGQRFTVNMPSGPWDLRANTCDNVYFWEQYGTDLTGGYEWLLTDASVQRQP